ncbi:MAG TPA: DUF420 domain-containing protein [Opitutae bacterium]|nr:DUF420 domain-containing protein [Opitutae bacterium]|tara:strand:+ start:677 stop:1120 length:444 start_codon:yes stop_codon:yes gene_type:complete
MASGFPFPEVNASLNACSTVLLTLGFIFIKMKRVEWHRAMMLGALGVSALFLVSYVIYHLQTGARTPFGGEGLWRTVYFVLLLTHIVLAVVIVPLVLRTFFLAIRGRYATHRIWARWTYPLWYYVSVTGVLVYFFLYQWFPSSVVSS